MASQQLWDALNYLSENLRVFAPIKDEIAHLIDENEALKKENAKLREKHTELKTDVEETQGVVNELMLMVMGGE